MTHICMVYIHNFSHTVNQVCKKSPMKRLFLHSSNTFYLLSNNYDVISDLLCSHYSGSANLGLTLSFMSHLKSLNYYMIE